MNMELDTSGRLGIGLSPIHRRVKVYEAVLRQLNAFGNLVPNHEKMRELMVVIMEWQYACRDGEYTLAEQIQREREAFDKLAEKVGL